MIADKLLRLIVGSHCWICYIRSTSEIIIFGFLTQSYTGIPKNLTRQVKQLFIWYPKKRKDFRAIHEENGVLTNEELTLTKDKLKKSKYACLFIYVEFPRCWVIINRRSNKEKPQKSSVGKKWYQARLLKLKEEILAKDGITRSLLLTAGTTGTNTATNPVTTGSTATTPGY